MKTSVIVIIMGLLFSYPGELLAQWVVQNSGTDKNLRSISFVDSIHGWIVGDDGVILHSDNGGKNWEKQSSFTNSNLNSVSFCDSLNGWAVGYGGIKLRTNDGGKNWIRILHDTANITRNDKVICLTPTKAFISRSQFYEDYYGGYLIWRTTDGGNIWTKVTPENTIRIDDFYFSSDKSGWLLDVESNSLEARVNQTTDGGNSWFNQQSNLISSARKIIEFETDSTGWITDGYKIYKTTNSGSSWTYRNNVQLFDPRGFTIKKNVGYALSSQYIFKTIDTGYTWTKQSLTSPNAFLDIQFLTKEVGWVVSTYGFVAATINGGITSAVDDHKIVSPEFNLNQNFPNPFNPSTKISFSLLTSSFVSIIIYNIYGQEIETILKQQLPSGQHNVQWKPLNLASGIYLYKFMAKDFTETKKAMFVK